VVDSAGHVLDSIVGLADEVRCIRDKVRKMFSHETGELIRLCLDACCDVDHDGCVREHAVWLRAA
jgi:hypothetical protein